MVAKFSNEASTTLAAAVAATDTTITVAAGGGLLFPTLTPPNDYFYATMFNATALEIVKVTAVSTDTLTVVRGQDDTTAKAFAAGDGIELRLVAAYFTNFYQVDNFVGVYAQLGVAQTFTKAQSGATVTLPYSATITPDFSKGNNFKVTLAGNPTIANPINMVPGTSGRIAIIQDNTGTRVPAFGSYFNFGSRGVPKFSTAIGAVDLIPFDVVSSTLIVCGFIGGA